MGLYVWGLDSVTLRLRCIILAGLLNITLSSSVAAYTQNRYFSENANPLPRPVRWGPPTKRDGQAPLVISNACPETLWPAIGTQAGTGPGTGGFQLLSGAMVSLSVSQDWQGRVWGRTNCSFNAAGTGASNLNGKNGAGAACSTGDCGGVLDCVHTGETPVTLSEFDLAGGVDGRQVFYDISLVDGYNLPMGITFMPGDVAKLQRIPPRLTNCACIGTSGYLAPFGTELTESANSIPYEAKHTNSTVAEWCPWDLQVHQPTGPVDGVYSYPDDSIQRPIFDPCLSACSKSNSPVDCCTGIYNDPKVCKPPLYAKQAKSVCPDAYSFAYDDQTSTFIVPSGGGWKVQFCPEGRSTNILATHRQELLEIASMKKAKVALGYDLNKISVVAREIGKGEQMRSRASAVRAKMWWMSLVVAIVCVV